MKKLLLLSLTVFAIAGKAQNTLAAEVGEKVCVTEITVIFSDHSQKEFDLGCTGLYEFDTEFEMEYIIVNGMVCPAAQTTLVKLPDSSEVNVSLRPVGRITFKAKEGATIAR